MPNRASYYNRSPLFRISGWGKRRGAASTAVEQKARSLLPPSELPALAYYMEEYAARRLTPDAFLTVLRDLLDTQQKVHKSKRNQVQLFTKVR